jgi:hypothetical protein
VYEVPGESVARSAFERDTAPVAVPSAMLPGVSTVVAVVILEVVATEDTLIVQVATTPAAAVAGAPNVVPVSLIV